MTVRTAHEQSVYSHYYVPVTAALSNLLVFSLDYPLSPLYPALMKLRASLKGFLSTFFKEYFCLDRIRKHCLTNYLIKQIS